MLSVIIPAYNEADMVPAAAERILAVLDGAGIPCELIFADDGSKDGTWAAVQAAAKADPRIRGLSFSRNFGKEAALMAGLRLAAGDCCVTLDCDLQHPPEKIPEMYALFLEGYDVVEGVKTFRGRESALHRLCTRAFYGIMTRVTGCKMDNRSDFKLLSRRAVDALLSLRETDTFYRALSAWVGFRTAELPFEVAPRQAGESKWRTGRLIRYAVRNITGFTAFPLHITTWLGAVMLLFALILGVQTLINKVRGSAAEGFTTVIIVLLLVGSLIMISLGIIGLYLSRLFEEVKGRPRYIIAETVGIGEDHESVHP